MEGILHVFHTQTHVASILDVAFSLRNLECSMQHETYLRRFFSHHWWMDNKFFQHTSMLQTLIFDVVFVEFSILQTLFGYCIDRTMGDVPIRRPGASMFVVLFVSCGNFRKPPRNIRSSQSSPSSSFFRI